MIITGGMGFIGSHLKGKIIDPKYGNDLFYVREVDEPVVHLAAVSSVQYSIENPTETWRLNIMGLAKVIDLCKASGQKLIFASSSSVYEPKSPYAYSKLWGEQMLRMAGVNYVILRFGNVYGEGDDKSAIYHFMNDDKITIYGDGSVSRSFVYVKDVANAIEQSLDWPSGVYEVGHETYTIKEVAEMFGKPISYSEKRDGDAHYYANFGQFPAPIEYKTKLKDWINEKH